MCSIFIQFSPYVLILKKSISLSGFAKEKETFATSWLIVNTLTNSRFS